MLRFGIDENNEDLKFVPAMVEGATNISDNGGARLLWLCGGEIFINSAS